jgi:hypothetical protein
MRLIPMIAAALAVVGLGLTAMPAEAKQCVWNKGGFVLRVDWMKPGTVTAEPAGSDGHLEFSFTEQPVQTDVFPAAQGRCIDRGATQYETVLSICGRSTQDRVILYPSSWPEDQRINCGLWTKDTPSDKRYLDVWGGLYNPDRGPGGGI